MISKRAKSVWAKTGGAEQWLPLTQHMLDSRAVAALLVEYWLSPQVRRRWIAHPLGSDGIGRIAVFLAAVHDVGKASPVFVAQSEPLAQRTRDTGLPCPIMDELRPDRAVLQHSVVSQHALRTWLIDLGLGSEAARGLASVIGMPACSQAIHSSRSPSDEMIGIGPGISKASWGQAATHRPQPSHAAESNARPSSCSCQAWRGQTPTQASQWAAATR